MQSKESKEFYTDNNLVGLIKRLPFDKKSLPKFLDDHKGRIQQIKSAEDITNFIIATSSKCVGIKVDKHEYWNKDDFIESNVVDLFQNQFKTQYTYEDFIHLLSEFLKIDDSSIKYVARSILKHMLHLIKDGDQLIQVVMIVKEGQLENMSNSIVENVEKQQFFNYTDNNLVALIKLLPFDKKSLSKFLDDHKGRIQQMKSAEDITNFILDASTKCVGIKVDKHEYWSKDDFIESNVLDLFQNQFKTLYKFEDFIQLLSETLKIDDSSIKYVARSILKHMLHLIKDGDKLIQVLDIVNEPLNGMLIDIVDTVEKMSGKKEKRELKNANANQFFNNQSSGDDSLSSNDSDDSYDTASTSSDSSNTASTSSESSDTDSDTDSDDYESSNSI